MNKLFFAVLAGALIGLVAEAASTHGNTKYAFERNQFVLQDDAVSIVGSALATGGSIKLYDLPAGNIIVHGVACDVLVTCTGVVAGNTFTLAVGSAGNAVGTAAVSATETNMGFVTYEITSGVTRAQFLLANPVRLDGTATASDIYLSLYTTNCTATNVSAEVQGTVHVLWSLVGDY